MNRSYDVPEEEVVILGSVKSKSTLTIPYKQGVNETLFEVSGSHCELKRSDISDVVDDPEKTKPISILKVKDLNSTNGTSVDGNTVGSENYTPLKNGSILALGRYLLDVIIEVKK